MSEGKKSPWHIEAGSEKDDVHFERIVLEDILENVKDFAQGHDIGCDVRLLEAGTYGIHIFDRKQRDLLVAHIEELVTHANLLSESQKKSHLINIVYDEDVLYLMIEKIQEK
jgi:hypothetical protein